MILSLYYSYYLYVIAYLSFLLNGTDTWRACVCVCACVRACVHFFVLFQHSMGSSSPSEQTPSKSMTNTKIFVTVGMVCAVSLVVGFLVGFFVTPRQSSNRNEESAASRLGKQQLAASMLGNEEIAASRHSRRHLEVAPNRPGFNVNKFILKTLNKKRIRASLRKYSSQPRLAGTPLDKELAHTIANDWRTNGLEEVHLATYHVLLSFPNTSAPNKIQLLDASYVIVFESHPYEVVLTPAENNSQVVPPFNAYSPAGDVIGNLIYVNYGTIEDFEFLTQNLSVNVAGAIVIARHGKIYRGDKVKHAERFGASGVILYSDPSDYNMDNTETYPYSWWLPPSGIQRGSIIGVDGDPQTPLYPSTYYAHRLPLNESQLPRIPCQPIGNNDAEKLLRSLRGQQAPADWQGKLNFTYYIGSNSPAPPDSKVRLVVNNYMEVKPIYNVIGYIKGREEPDRYVLLGNHHDAWAFGAVDPLSGSAALTEIARVFGEMLKKGFRPRRTVVFCSWDSEEYSLQGSTEWVEDHLKLLHERGVAYLNLDYAGVSNYTIALGTSPLLQDLLYTSAKKVPSPNPLATTLYDLWLKRPIRTSCNSTKEACITYSLGSSSDMAAFYQRAGVSSIDLWVDYDEINMPILNYPLYHSSYETFLLYDKYMDPGFIFTRAVSQLLAIVVSELANSEILPMNVVRYSAAVESFQTSLLAKFRESWEKHGIDIDTFLSAGKNFTLATKQFAERLHDDSTLSSNPIKRRMVNDQIMMLERAFLDPEGLPGRPMQKHIMFAPSLFDAYVDNTFPGITDTMYDIEQGKDEWEQLKKQVFIATYIIQSAASTLEEVGL